MARRMGYLRPVQSIKHVIDTNGSISAGAPSTNDVIDTVNSPVTGTSNQCSVGSTVNALFLNVQVVPVIASGGVNNIYMIVYKNPGANVTGPAVDTVGISDKKRFVIHQEMLMLSNGITLGDNNPRTLFKGVIKLPPRMKRNGIQDKWQVIIGHRSAEATQVSEFCLQAIYKEFK